MKMPHRPADMRFRLLAKYPGIASELAKLSDLELLEVMITAYQLIITAKEAQIAETQRRLDELARALFSPAPH